jgi:hypothetical protein
MGFLDLATRACRICGCTDTTACTGQGANCHWVEDDLCSYCEGCGQPVSRCVVCTRDLDSPSAAGAEDDICGECIDDLAEEDQDDEAD